MEGLWGLITIVGPILLAAAILYAVVTNRRRTKAQVDRTERATREQYERTDPESGGR
ncbi:MAG: hypothetical protein ABW173_00285 [Sphingomonas sp.]